MSKGFSGGSSPENLRHVQGKNIMRNGRAIQQRSKWLLDMEYKPSELAAELHVSDITLYKWFTGGAPHRKDATGHLWIHGVSMAAWIENHVSAAWEEKPRIPMSENQAFCMSCRQAVEIGKVTRRAYNNRTLRIQGFGVCGHKVSRIVATKDKDGRK